MKTPSHSHANQTMSTGQAAVTEQQPLGSLQRALLELREALRREPEAEDRSLLQQAINHVNTVLRANTAQMKRNRRSPQLQAAESRNARP